MDRTVCIVLVTYNRKQLLTELLNSLLTLTHQPKGIVIVDNDSNDGTPELLQELGIIKDYRVDEVALSDWNSFRVYYYRNSYNAGGSGGFAKAFDLVRTLPYDCVWAMDDDVQPDPTCLSSLLEYLDDEARVVVPSRSDAAFTDYAIQRFDLKNPLYFHVNQCKRDKQNGAKLETPFVYVQDMAFEGPLVDMKLIQEIGIPNQDYFILFDDTDYAQRALRVTKIRYIRDAKLHKKIIPQFTSTWSWKSYYNFRNTVYFDKVYGENFAVRTIRPMLRLVDLLLRSVIKGNFYRMKWLIRAYRDGVQMRMGKTYEISELTEK